MIPDTRHPILIHLLEPNRRISRILFQAGEVLIRKLADVPG